MESGGGLDEGGGGDFSRVEFGKWSCHLFLSLSNFHAHCRILKTAEAPCRF